MEILDFDLFQGPTRPISWREWKKGVIERVSANQDAHDALCHHFEIEHVCDGTITIALIIEIGIVTTSRRVIVPPHVP